MLLAVDVGNTETKLGLFGADAAGEIRLLQRRRIRTVRGRTADEFAIVLRALFDRDEVRAPRVSDVAVSSVVPQLDGELREASLTAFGCDPRFFVPAEQRLMPIRTDHPREVGADIVAGALGARARYGAPLIVLGFGTATTYAAVDAAGDFVGAAIAPGIRISVDALVARTAKLRQVALDAPPAAIGRDTVTALQSGVVFGFVAQSEGMVARIARELGGRPTVVATGGLAPVVADRTTAIDAVEPHLVLDGLRLWATEKATGRT